MNLSNKTVCIVDNGLFVSFARKIAPSFKKCYYNYFRPSSMVRTVDVSVGKGFPELEVIAQPLTIADEIDLWVFLDLYHSGLQVFLKKHGARVWGAGRGEELELERWVFKQHLKRIGLPVQPVERVFGFDELRKLLKVRKDVYVKTSFTRGDFETFKHISYDLSEPLLAELEHQLGPEAEDYEFIVENEIKDAVEVGYDGFAVDGEFPKTAMMAYEVKDIGMIGMVKTYPDLAKPVKDVNTALSETLRKYQYRSFLCTEIRYTKDRKPYLIDPCCRLGTPSNELLQELFTDWPEVLWEGGEGILRSPKPIVKYGVLAVIHSEWAVNNWQAVHYPRELDQYVKLRYHRRRGDRDYIVPQVVGSPDIGCIVGTGQTLMDAIRQCKERASQVKGYQIEVTLESIDRALEVIEKGEKFGVRFADSLPSKLELQKV